MKCLAAAAVIFIKKNLMNAILQPLIDSPLLPEYVTELNRILQEEEARKRKFVEDLDEDTKAEFIQGEIVIHSPARVAHMLVVQSLQLFLVKFLKENSQGIILSEQALIRFKRSDLMPDISFWKTEKAKVFKPDTKLLPPPDFVIEVLSPFTEKYDRNRKKDEYAQNGVQEYWIVDADKKTIEQYILEEGDYTLREKLSHGTIQAAVITGLELPLKEIFE